MSPVSRLSGDLLILDKALPLFKEPAQLFLWHIVSTPYLFKIFFTLVIVIMAMSTGSGRGGGGVWIPNHGLLFRKFPNHVACLLHFPNHVL